MTDTAATLNTPQNSLDPLKLKIDIVSDVMCPWCIIGYLQLEQAIKQTNTTADIHWHPFELNPNMPNEGQNVREHLMEKYGVSSEESNANRRRLTNLGAQMGFVFHYSDDLRMHNSFKMHQLLHWAGLQETQGKQHDLKRALFRTHFTNNLNVSDNTVLADIASSVGLDKDKALQVLEDERFANAVRAEEKHYIEKGITGVPAMIFDDRYLVSGAQGIDHFIEVINQVNAEKLAK